MDNKLQQLEYYCQHHLFIFPVHWMDNGLCSCGSPTCKSPGKHPLVAHGFKSATTDSNQVHIWNERWPQANWGMRTGDIQTGGSGVVVIDIDAESSGYETWEMLRNENPEPIETVTVETGRGGSDIYGLFFLPALKSRQVRECWGEESTFAETAVSF